MPKKFYSLVSDTTFKYLFKSKRTRKWIEEIIYEKCHIDLRNYILVDNELNTGSKIKDYRMDLILTDGIDYVIIEMNDRYSEGGEIKAIKYLFRKASIGYDKGEKYDNISTVKLIMFNNYYSKENKDIDVSHYEIIDRKNNLKIKDIEIYKIYLKLFHKMCYDKCSKIDKRLWLFGIKKYEELERIKNDDNKIIVEEMGRLRMNEKYVEEYDYENIQRKLRNSDRDQGIREGEIRGEKRGEKKGAQRKSFEIAKNMLQENFDIRTISKITKIPASQLQKLS